jgi:hypothetical protein
MKERLSFKEYYESKRKLLSACDMVPRIRTEYVLTKYCKFPIFESVSDDSKVYVSFKPRDIIEVIWEKVNEDDGYPAAKCIVLVTEGRKEVFPCWNNKKIHNWVNRNTNER